MATYALLFCQNLSKMIKFRENYFKKEFSNTAHTFFQNQNMAKTQEAISKRNQGAKPTSEL